MTPVILLTLIAVAAAIPVSLDDNTGSNHEVNLNASEADLKIYYFSRKVSSGVLVAHSNFQGNLDKTDFSSSKRTVFAIHGWRNSERSPVCEEIREAYLKAGDVNVFVIDWSSLASKDYMVSVQGIGQIASALGKIIGNWESSHGLSLDKTLIVGHSLGAHLAGFTGAALGGKVAVIVGLDPAGPGYNKFMSGGRLNPSNAKFVQAVHTCAGVFGVDYNVGHADYFANDGTNQPGCESDSSGACNHGRAFDYFSESVKTGKFESAQCDNYRSFKSGACSNHKTSKMGGFDIDTSASGTYYFETNSSPPYAKS